MQRDETIAFLRCILPSEGYYCAVVFPVANPRPGVDKPRHIFVDTIEELTDVLLSNDTQGRTVFHACASFREKTHRRKDNVFGLRSFWMDIDAGEGKPYADATEAALAVASFCRDVSLPDPVYVGSGTGIHCYWPFERALDPTTWRSYADGLKQLCQEHGLKIDPARTSDAASILRPPGTHHRKNGEKLVRASVGSQHHDKVFNSLRGQLSPGSLLPNQERRDSIIGRVLAPGGFSAAYADNIADECAQLDLLRRSGSMDGHEGWYVRLGVLAFCEDGEVKAHEWSSNDYPEYSYAQTQAKLDRAKTFTGATTCAKLNDVSPGVCQRCIHWGKINSPISLGDGHAKQNHQEPVSVGDVPVLPIPPKSFRWSETGQLLFEAESNKGEATYVLVSDNPIYLETVQTGELSDDLFSLRFRRYLPKRGWSNLVIDAATLFGAQGIAALAGKGTNLHEPKAFLDYVRHQVDDYHHRTDLETRFDQFGWKNDEKSFLYGKLLYTSVGPVDAAGAKELSANVKWLTPTPDGSLYAWTEAANALFATDMEAAATCVLASFAAPLMRFQSRDEGGAILHLWSPSSGAGKTTAAAGAITVWGVKEGLSLTNEDTKVSKPIRLGTLANLPVVYDELRDRDPEAIKRFVIMFTEGRDRMRGMVDGTIRHTKANWQTILISNANTSLTDQLTGDDTDAPAYRVLELEAKLSSNMDKAKADKLKAIMTNNAGHAGDAYLRYLLRPDVLEWAKAALEKWTQEIWDTTRLTAPHRFRVRLVGCIAVAAALVNKLGILDFKTDRILNFLIDQLGRNDAAETGVQTVSSMTSIDRAIDIFGAFVNEHYGETLVVPDRWKPKLIVKPLLSPHNRLCIRYEVAPQRVYIAYSVFRDWCLKKSVSPKQALLTLQEHGVTHKPRPVTLSAGTDIPGAQVLCIEANAQHPVMSGMVAMVDSLRPAEASPASR